MPRYSPTIDNCNSTRVLELIGVDFSANTVIMLFEKSHRVNSSMAQKNVELSLSEASKMLDKVVARREKLIKDSRDVISLSSKSVISLHQSDIKEAKRLHKEAKQRLAELRKIADVDLIRYLSTPEQEFVESSVMFSMKANEDIPSLDQLKVRPSSYILGLLDAIGELKRSVYDSIRKGDLESAEKHFSAMETLFALISPFAVYDNIVQGVRRKLDVARILIEDTRATVTEEARRLEFMSAMNSLASKLGRSAPLTTTKRRLTEGVSEENPEILSTNGRPLRKRAGEEVDGEVEDEKETGE